MVDQGNKEQAPVIQKAGHDAEIKFTCNPNPKHTTEPEFASSRNKKHHKPWSGTTVIKS